MLVKGGSAVDAAVATLLCMGVTHPQSMGLGGGTLMTIYDRKAHKAEVIDAREVAPAASHESFYTAHPNRTVTGGLAAAVPGELRGYWVAHNSYGRLPWDELVRPAIRMCTKGVMVSNHLANALRAMHRRVEEEPSLREVFVNPKTGKVYRGGDVLIQSTLAETLSAIAEGGADALYTGPIGRLFVEDLRRYGSSITVDDFRNYSPIRRKAMQTQLSSGITLFSTPPPGCGPVLAHILHILEGFKVDETTLEMEKDAALFAHRLVETLKFAFAQRTLLGDPAFVDMNEVTMKLLSRSYASSIREKISSTSVLSNSSYGIAGYPMQDSGTSHLSVLAPDGDAVSVTSTVNTWLGAGFRSRHTGLVLNNEMDDFSYPTITNHFGVPPSPSNFMKPGKRPQSSMCPAIFVDRNGNACLVIGAAGGTRILSSMTQSVVRSLWMGMNLKDAVDARRLHHQLIPNEVQLEEGFSETISKRLRKLGHRVVVHSARGSIVIAVHRNQDGLITAYSDFRKDGSTAGF